MSLQAAFFGGPAQVVTHESPPLFPAIYDARPSPRNATIIPFTRTPSEMVE